MSVIQQPPEGSFAFLGFYSGAAGTASTKLPTFFFLLPLVRELRACACVCVSADFCLSVALTPPPPAGHQVESSPSLCGPSAAGGPVGGGWSPCACGCHCGFMSVLPGKALMLSAGA